MFGVVVNFHPVGDAAGFQCLCKGRPLQGVDEGFQHGVIPAVPQEGGRIVRRHELRDGVGIVASFQPVGIHQEMVGRLCPKEVVDGVDQQQYAGLRHTVAAPALFLIAEDACELSAGGVAQQGVVFRRDAEGVGIVHHEADGPGQVFQRSVVPGLPSDAVAQREDGIALLVQLPRRGHAAPQLAAVVERVARQHDGKPGPRLLGRAVIQLHMSAGRHGGDLLFRIERIGHPGAVVVDLSQIVEARCAGFGRGLADHLGQRLVVAAGGELFAVPLPHIGICIETAGLDVGVVAYLLHGGLGGDAGC